jgi:phosphatidylinositol alpha-1,6-mannosyltransferase
MKHLLVTNDFPPKTGGIQNYLLELWSRLPSGSTAVLTTPFDGAAEFDADQPMPVFRDRSRVLLPTRALARRVDALAAELEVDLVLLDPAVPLGIIGPWLERPYGVIVHGAEVTIPGRSPVSRRVLARVLAGSRVVIAAGGYPASEAMRCAGVDLPTIVIPPGVDTERFEPVDIDRRRSTRERFGLDVDAPLVLGMSRLVPRKGFDVVIDAAATLASTMPGLQVAIAGSGRDRRRLERRAVRRGVDVSFLGRVDDDDLAPLLASADVFAMLCRDRWFGLEQEGFGIVFLEAAACGVPSVAGRSGGSSEAVIDGVTGLVVARPRDVRAAASGIGSLLADGPRRRVMGGAARTRVANDYTYDLLAERLHRGLAAVDLGDPPRRPPATRTGG